MKKSAHERTNGHEIRINILGFDFFRVFSVFRGQLKEILVIFNSTDFYTAQ
jgi:hypothetical protein